MEYSLGIINWEFLNPYRLARIVYVFVAPVREPRLLLHTLYVFMQVLYEHIIVRVYVVSFLHWNALEFRLVIDNEIFF